MQGRRGVRGEPFRPAPREVHGLRLLLGTSAAIQTTGLVERLGATQRRGQTVPRDERQVEGRMYVSHPGRGSGRKVPEGLLPLGQVHRRCPHANHAGRQRRRW